MLGGPLEGYVRHSGVENTTQAKVVNQVFIFQVTNAVSHQNHVEAFRQLKKYNFICT